MKLYTIILTVLFGTMSVYAVPNRPATDLPDVSVIGNFVGRSSSDKKDFSVAELEFGFQQYLYPGLRAEVFMAMHKEANGERVFDVEEAKVSISNIFDLFILGNTQEYGVSAVIGKSLLPVGRDNMLHPEQRAFVDKPLASEMVYGPEGLSSEGVRFSFPLPLPFFSQLETGFATASSGHAHEEEEGEEEEAHGIEYEGRLLHARFWNSYAFSDTKELEFSTSYLLGNATADEADEKKYVWAFDTSYTYRLSGYKYFKLFAEYFSTRYAHEGESLQNQQAYYVMALYRLNAFYETGLRYSVLGQHGDEGSDISQFSVMLTKRLTDTTRFRLQYNMGDGIENTMFVQFIFGMGPHAHVIQ